MSVVARSLLALPLSRLLRVCRQDVRLQARLDKPTMIAVNAIVDSARIAKLPTAPLVDKALEGAAKGSDGQKIIAAVQQLSVRMGSAKRVLGTAATSDEIKAGAGAIDAGVSARDLARLRAAAGKRPVTMPLAVLSDLIGRSGAGPDGDEPRRSAREDPASRIRTSRCFSATCARDIDRGADPTVAATTRARGLVLRTADQRTKPVRVAAPPTDRVQFPVYGSRGIHASHRAQSLVALSLCGGSRRAQQADTRSIPAKSKYTLQSFAGKRPLTRAERTNFTETSHYDDVLVFIDSLKTLGAKIATGSIGKTVEGRELPYVIASRPLITTPAEARRLQPARRLHPGEHPRRRSRRKGSDAVAASRSALRQEEERARLDRADRAADLQCRRQREVGAAGTESRRATRAGAGRHAPECLGLESESRLHRRRRAGNAGRRSRC